MARRARDIRAYTPRHVRVGSPNCAWDSTLSRNGPVKSITPRSDVSRDAASRAQLEHRARARYPSLVARPDAARRQRRPRVGRTMVDASSAVDLRIVRRSRNSRRTSCHAGSSCDRVGRGGADTRIGNRRLSRTTSGLRRVTWSIGGYLLWCARLVAGFWGFWIAVCAAPSIVPPDVTWAGPSPHCSYSSGTTGTDAHARRRASEQRP
jgi:hypothetical protein